MKKQDLLVYAFLLFSVWAIAQRPPQYKEEILTLKLKDGALEGTLVTPAKAKKMPIVLIIAGSGPTDRDCNSALGLKTNSFKMLADSLARLGIASFRYDKRHIGKSKMTQKAEDVVFEDFVDDAVRWLDTLKTMKKKRHFTKFIIAGHSEGSLIGMLAVQKTKTDALISLSGPAQSMDNMIYTQVGKQAAFLVPQLKDIYGKWQRGEKVDSVPPMLMSLAHPKLRTFMVSCMKYTPTTEISKLTLPILIVSGKHDIQVLGEDAEALSKANPKATVVYFDNMTHVLKDGDANLMAAQITYSKTELPLTVGVADALAKFIQKY